MERIVHDLKIPAHVVGLGPVFQIWFADQPIRNYRDAVRHADHNAFRHWFEGMLKRGVLFHPGAYENLFISVAHTRDDIDVTLKAVMLEEDARHLRAHNTKASNLAAELLEFMFRRRDKGHEDAVMHDALAFAAAFCPECLRTEKLYVDVECAGEYTWGHTFADLRGRLGRPANADVALGIDVEKFRKYLLDCYDRS